MLLQLVLEVPVRLEEEQRSKQRPPEPWTKDRFLPCYVLQKLPGEEVVADVSSAEDQVSSRSSQLRRLWLDLAVLHNLEGTLHFADHAQRLCRVGLLHHLTHSSQGWTFILVPTSGPGPALVLLRRTLYLGPAVGSSAHAEADEDGVGHLDQDVVHAVDVQVLHPPPLHVLQDPVVHQRLVQTSVSVWWRMQMFGNSQKRFRSKEEEHTWRHGDLAFVLEKDLPLEGHSRDHPLLKHDDVGRFQAEVAVPLEEVLSGSQSELTGHDVPEQVEQKPAVNICPRWSGLDLCWSGLDLCWGLTTEPSTLSRVFCPTTPGFCGSALPGSGTRFSHWAGPRHTCL